MLEGISVKRKMKQERGTGSFDQVVSKLLLDSTETILRLYSV